MKLRNKKTGKIGDYVFVTSKEKGTIRLTDGNIPVEDIWEFDSLAELFEYFEDYEPKTNNRFRLVKDLPTFKAGQEFHLSPKGNLILNDGKFGIYAYAKQTLEKFPNILEDWFEPIDDGKNTINTDKVNELIDKIHPEPLIKDEKIRKAVKAWAEANGAVENTEITFECDKDRFWYLGKMISFEDVDSLEIGHYTITELCGEEE